MIVDAFPFFDELELLEVRLHELSSVVDRFVLVEATRTHSNRPKPLHYHENRDRFRAFADRIVHVVVDDLPETGDAWEIEKSQRDAVARGLDGCSPDDAILVSDLDEIPRASRVAEAVSSLPVANGPASRWLHAVVRSRFVRHPLRRWFKRRHPFLVVFEHTAYLGSLNLRAPARKCLGTRLCRLRDFTRARELRGLGGRVIEDGGWHFSSMGGVERVRAKLAAFAHRELDVPSLTDPERLHRALAEGADLYGRPEPWQR
ncbi:MAG: hypothetical protein ACREQQ_14110, partial [Candidatus Binatia bacterium]